MTHSSYVKTKKRIKRFVDTWIGPLGLRWWEVNTDYYDDSGNFPEPAAEGYHVAAKCYVNWPYRSCTISFNVPKLETYTDEELEKVVIHEMMHVVVNEMRDDTEDSIKHEERVCESLALAFQSVRKKYDK